jgi:DNA-binding CsgD family transcriptional regulator
LVAAEAALFAADYALSRHLIDVYVPADRKERGESALLRAQVARHENNAEDWYAAATTAAAHLDDPARKLLATALRAGAAKRLGKARESRTLFEEAARDLARVAPGASGFSRYLLALDAWENQDFGRAEGLARENIAANASEGESLALLGWLATKRERFGEAGTHFASALRHQQGMEKPDFRIEAYTLNGLAIVASETIDLRLAERVRKGYERIAWTTGLGAIHFSTLASLRNLALLEGDLTGAFFLSRAAIAVAPRIAFTAFGETNAAVMSRLLGDRGAERLQLQRAWDILRTERWTQGNDEARLALKNFIIEGAELMPAEARKAMAVYRSLTPKRSAADALYGDRRVLAFEAMAAGRLADSAGDEDAAISAYERSFELWRALGYDMRAALVALDLRRLTGDESYAGAIRSVLTRAPKAWFAKQFRAGTSPVDRLSPAERVVLAHLINGDSAKAIGAKLDRSPFTISNHTRKIFQAFGLNSRAKVIARCAELGITAAKVERDTR